MKSSVPDETTDYVPCTTPINMTITIAGQPEIPLHPLDLTTESQANPSSSTCVGLIQTAGGIMDTSPTVSDMILGVPFLRNVYTVMAYDVPDARGIFPNNSASDADDLLHPQVGLLSLTDPTRAMQEFNNVRVLNVPLSSGNPASDQAISSNKGRLSVGIDVLLALVGVIGACFALFGLRWFVVRRRLRQSSYLDAVGPKHDGASTAYPLGYQTAYLSIESAPPRISLDRSIAGNSTLTVIGQDDTALGEFGSRRFKDKDNGDDGEREVSYLNLDPGDSSGWRDTLVGSTVDFPKLPDPTSAFEAAVLVSDEPISSTHDAALAASLVAGFPMHRHTASDIGTGLDEAGMAEPLLAHMEHAHHGSMDSIARSDDDDLAEFGAARESMAGIGTAGRSPRIRARRGSGEGSFGSLMSMSLPSAIDPAPRVGLDAYFMTIAPGERASAYSSSLTEAARGNAIPQPLPPPSPPPP